MFILYSLKVFQSLTAMEGIAYKVFLLRLFASIDPNRIIMEDKATCTLENLQYSMDIINKLSIQDPVIGLVSSEYHLHRAKRLADYVGIDVIGIAAKTSFPTVAVNYFIREAFAMTEQYVFGYEGV